MQLWTLIKCFMGLCETRVVNFNSQSIGFGIRKTPATFRAWYIFLRLDKIFTAYIRIYAYFLLLYTLSNLHLCLSKRNGVLLIFLYTINFTYNTYTLYSVSISIYILVVRNNRKCRFFPFYLQLYSQKK